MELLDRFITYAQIDTAGAYGAEHVPSTLHQFDLAHEIVYELKEMGVEDVHVDKNCYVYARIPATLGRENDKKLGLIAHMDTNPDCPGENVKPQIIYNYSGTDINIGHKQSLTCREFPWLPSLKGQTLITTDGTTILGADGKAGIAEIITALEHILHEKLPHGPIRLAFIPDEEISGQATLFDLEEFDADYAYTVDGLEAGEIVSENFYAVDALVEVHGQDSHIGMAKGVMINSMVIARKMDMSLPAEERPEYTEGKEGFYHLRSVSGSVELTRLEYKLRDFTPEGIRTRQEKLAAAVQQINETWGPQTATVTFTEKYKNMKPILESTPEPMKKAVEACRKSGVEPKLYYARGGTIGARLSYKGLPCPNLGIGGYAYKSLREHITLESMQQVTHILENLML